jgi:Ser/Thr protein kinase RdoA (MazF antagonist)
MRGVVYELESRGFKLEQEYQFPASPRTLRRMLAQYGVAPCRIRRATGGIENETFVVECDGPQYVLRVYRQYKKMPDEIYRELDFMQFLAKNGMVVPRLIENSKGRLLSEVTIDGVVWRGILMNLMPGSHPASYTPRLLGDMARLQARLHGLGREYAELSLRHQDTLRQTAAGPAGRWGWRCYGLVRRAATAFLPFGYSHFDFTPSNVLVDRGRVTAILDFDDMAYGPLVGCLAVTLNRLPQGLRAVATLEHYVSAYETVRPLGEFEYLYLWFLFNGKQLLRRVLRFAS